MSRVIRGTLVKDKVNRPSLTTSHLEHAGDIDNPCRLVSKTSGFVGTKSQWLLS